jgi:hypothetical protein
MKKIYAAPTMELFPLETSGTVMNTSDLSAGGTDAPSYPGNPAWSSAPYNGGSNSTATGSDLEDMINDILTY